MDWDAIVEDICQEFKDESESFWTPVEVINESLLEDLKPHETLKLKATDGIVKVMDKFFRELGYFSLKNVYGLDLSNCECLVSDVIGKSLYIFGYERKDEYGSCSKCS